MNTIHSTPIVTVPAFGQGQPVERVIRTEQVRVELDPARADQLTDAALVAAQLEKAGVALQPQLRGPAALQPDDTRVEAFVTRTINAGVSGAALWQDSFDRHFSTAAEDVDAADQSGDVLKDVPLFLSPGWAGLFAAFLEALRDSKRANRELSVEQSKMAFESAKRAGNSGVDAARDQLVGAIISATVTTGISAGHVAKSAQSAKVTSNSAQQNQIPQPAAPTPPAAPTTAATPSAPTANAVSEPRLPSTPDVPQTPAPAPANAASDGLALTPEQNAAHTIAQAQAGKLHGQGLFLQTIAAPMGQIAGSGSQVAAAADEAARLEAQSAAEAARQISSTQSEQASHDEQLRDAALQVLERLYSERQQSNSRIIGNM